MIEQSILPLKMVYNPNLRYTQFQWNDPVLLKNGPIPDYRRKYHDLCCTIFFLLFVAGCIVIAVLSFINGHPSKLLYTYDEDGKACGHSEGYEDYPYLYFYSSINNTNETMETIINGFCVKDCPDKLYDIEEYKNKDINLDCKPTKLNTRCEISLRNYYPSKPIVNRLCFPKMANEIKIDIANHEKIEIYDSRSQNKIEKIINKDQFYIDQNNNKYVLVNAINGKGNPMDASSHLIKDSYFNVESLARWITDLYTTRWIIFGSIIWSFVIAFIFLLLLKFIGGLIVFLFFVLIEIGLIVMAVYFKVKSVNYVEQGDFVYKGAMVAFFWICLVLAILFLLFILLMCNKIRLSMLMISVTSQYINEVCSIILIPLLFFVIELIWIIYWLVLSLFIYSTGDFDDNGSKVIASFKWTAGIRFSWWYHLFALLYISSVISVFSEFIYSSTASIWYFNNEKGTEESPIKKSFYRGLRFHFGSLAFGAIIVPIIQFIMFFFDTFKKRVESLSIQKEQNQCLKCMICCLQCCLGCIGRFTEFINSHAYTQIAISGDSFWNSAWEGYGLIVRNLGRFSVMSFIGDMFSFISSLFVGVVSSLIGYSIIIGVKSIDESLNSYILPVVLFFVIGFFLGHVCMSIFGISGDALIFCFLLEEELNYGQAKGFPALQQFMRDERI